MMNTNFKEKISEILKVYMDGMVVKSSEEELKVYHLTSVFKRVW